jgi:hypothetical protein
MSDQFSLTDPSMSQTPPAAASHSADSSAPAPLEYDTMGDGDSAEFEKVNFGQSSWPPEARGAVKVANEFLTFVDPDKSLFGEAWSKDLGAGQRRGDSAIHIAAVARAAEKAERLMSQRLGLSRDDDGPRLTYSSMPLTDGQRRGLVRECRDILSRELMGADVEFIRHSKRGITNG